MEYSYIPNSWNGPITTARHLVSRDKIRYNEGGHDLDLTYITEKIIAMGYPSQDLVQSMYRNSVDDYSKFLDEKHPNHYLVLNLTEEPYESFKFHNRVVHFRIVDHHTPSFEILIKIMERIEDWLNSDASNVIAVHCKAGRGRTGTIISAFLLWSKNHNCANDALDFFALKRSSTTEGVMVPSQRRYVQYMGDFLTKRVLPFPAKKLVLEKILMKPVPNFTLERSCRPVLEIVNPETEELIYITPKVQWKLFDSKDVCIIMEPKLLVVGDILLRFYHQPSDLAKAVTKTFPMFRTAFHTSFIQILYLDFPKCQLDSGQAALADNRFAEDFSVRFIFSEFVGKPLEDDSFEE